MTIIIRQVDEAPIIIENCWDIVVEGEDLTFVSDAGKLPVSIDDGMRIEITA